MVRERWSPSLARLGRLSHDAAPRPESGPPAGPARSRRPAGEVEGPYLDRPCRARGKAAPCRLYATIKPCPTGE